MEPSLRVSNSPLSVAYQRLWSTSNYLGFMARRRAPVDMRRFQRAGLPWSRAGTMGPRLWSGQWKALQGFWSALIPMGSGGPTGGRASGRPCRGSAGPAWRRSPPVPAHGGLVSGWGYQKNFVCPEACFLCWDARSSARFRACRCFSAQVSHLLWPGIAGFGQSRQSPSSLDFRRFS